MTEIFWPSNSSNGFSHPSSLLCWVDPRLVDTWDTDVSFSVGYIQIFPFWRHSRCSIAVYNCSVANTLNMQFMHTLFVCRFIDSSEMVSTFGSSPYEVRGFIVGGWTACKNRECNGIGRGKWALRLNYNVWGPSFKLWLDWNPKLFVPQSSVTFYKFTLISLVAFRKFEGIKWFSSEVEDCNILPNCYFLLVPPGNKPMLYRHASLFATYNKYRFCRPATDL